MRSVAVDVADVAGLECFPINISSHTSLYVYTRCSKNNYCSNNQGYFLAHPVGLSVEHRPLSNFHRRKLLIFIFQIHEFLFLWDVTSIYHSALYFIYLFLFTAVI